MGLFAQRGDTARVDDLFRMVREDGIHVTTPMIDLPGVGSHSKWSPFRCNEDCR